MARNIRRLASCKRCVWIWAPRIPIDRIKWCPKCKSPYWNRDRIRPVKTPARKQKIS